MSFSDYLLTLHQIVSSIPFSILDYCILLLACLYIYQEIWFGLKSSIKHFVAISVSFLLGIFVYPLLSHLLTTLLPAFYPGYSDGVSFLVCEIFFLMVLFLGSSHVFHDDALHPLPLERFINGILAVVSFFMIISVIAITVLCLPVSNLLKDPLRNSLIPREAVQAPPFLDFSFRKLLELEPESSLGFISLNPTSAARLSVPFTSTYQEDTVTEENLASKINHARAVSHLTELNAREALSNLAHMQAEDMIRNHYFSHKTLDNFSLPDRLEANGISSARASESIAIAQSLELGFSGFSQSAGNRQNIYSSEFKTFGIAVYDVGTFGKLMVVIFTD